MTAGLRPFWRYYGGKWRAAPRYPRPRLDVIVEPFAGAAGYSLRYPDREVVLVEKYRVVAGIWRWLISASEDEVRAIPLTDDTHTLPEWVPQPARWLVGFCMAGSDKRPRRRLSSAVRRARDAGDYAIGGWSEPMRERVASQLAAIRHWRVIEGDYTSAPDVEATWFIDPPYQRAGVHYSHGSGALDFDALGEWCRGRSGQVVVCESHDATWLPFQPFGPERRVAINRSTSREAIWTGDAP